MLENEPFIHFFDTPGGKYIFDVNTNSIIKISKNVWDFLLQNQKGKKEKEDFVIDENIQGFVQNLKDKGFLKSKRVKEVVHPASEWLKKYMSNRLNMVTLQVTQQCNLRCEYCVYSGGYDNRAHSNSRMSFETAKKVIDFLLNNSKNEDRLSIGFYGGEPLLEFELIKKCVLYANELFEGKNVTYSITTNGTLFTKDNIEFLMENDVSIMISLDGPAEVHDKNRKFAVSGCGSFEKISKNLEFFKENYPEYFKRVSFNCVIDGKSNFGCLNDFFASYDMIKESPLNVSGVSEVYSKPGSDCGEEYDIRLKHEIDLKYENFKLYLSKLNKLDDSHVSKLIASSYDMLKRKTFDERTISKQLPDKTHHGGPCIPGAQRLFVDVGGNFFPCERVSESSETMHIGHVDKGFDYEKVGKLLNLGKLTEENCKNCWAFRFCSICAAFADDMKELSCKKKSSYCKNVRKRQEDYFRDFCILNEFGHKFENDSLYLEME